MSRLFSLTSNEIKTKELNAKICCKHKLYFRPDPIILHAKKNVQQKWNVEIHKYTTRQHQTNNEKNKEWQKSIYSYVSNYFDVFNDEGLV